MKSFLGIKNTGLKILIPVIAAAGLFPCALIAQGFDDEFNGTLDPRWEWVREDAAHQFLTTRELTIISQNGALYGIQYNDLKNILLQPAPSGTYACETKVTFSADSTFHNAGAIYYIDDDNYVLVSKGFYLGRPVVTMAWDIDGQFILHVAPIEPGSTLYLRLAVNAGRYFGAYFSKNGSDWVHAFTADIPFTTGGGRIGLQASNGEGVNVTQKQLPARFDYFHIDRTVGITDEPVTAREPALALYPSPVRQGARLSARLDGMMKGELSVALYDVRGRRLWSQRITPTWHTPQIATIPTAELPPGRYTIALHGSNAVLTRPFVVLPR